MGTGPAAAAEPVAWGDEDETPLVCAQVVLAIDASGSTRDGAFQRQIEAFGSAFGTARLYQAIQDCMPGSAAFTVATWSGPEQQALCLDWTLVDDGHDGAGVTAALAECQYFGGTTDIGRAVEFGLGLLEGSPFDSYYRVLLLLTNGRTDPGSEATLTAARAKAQEQGVTVSAYALLHHHAKKLSPMYVPDSLRLERYSADHIVAGPRAFVAHSRPEGDGETFVRTLVETLRQELN